MLDYKKRFTEALAHLTGSNPPESSVENWLYNEWDDDIIDLQSWINQQTHQPWWVQGGGILDAAVSMADAPVEGEEFHDKLDYSRLYEIQKEREFQKRLSEELSEISKETLISELNRRMK